MKGINLMLLISQVVFQASGTLSACVEPGSHDGQTQILHRKLEEALTNNSLLLFQLQKHLLNPTKPKQCYDLRLILEVGGITNTNDNLPCQNDMSRPPLQKCSTHCNHGNWTGQLEYTVCPNGLDEQQTSNLLLGYSTNRVLLLFDPLFNIMFLSTEINNSSLSASKNERNSFRIVLFLETLDTMPYTKDLTEAGRILLVWVSS